MSNNWTIFDSGNSIGLKGTENGIILIDEENINGARITLEENGDIAPFTITFGIYGIMFHTHFCSSNQKATIYIKKVKDKIDMIFLANYSIDDDEYYEKINELTLIE